MAENDFVVPMVNILSMVGYSKINFLLRYPPSGNNKEYIENIINYYHINDPLSTPFMAIYFLDFLNKQPPLMDESFTLFSTILLNIDDEDSDEDDNNNLFNTVILSVDDEYIWDIDINEIKNMYENQKLTIYDIIFWKFGKNSLDNFKEWVFENYSNMARRPI
jgi:hypothetical protein